MKPTRPVLPGASVADRACIAYSLYGIYAGYMPTSIFDWPSDQASGAGPMVDGPAAYLQAGGEVFHTWPSNKHSGTPMVSEKPASDGYQYAAYQRDIEYVNPDGYQEASLTWLTSPTVPSYMDDDNVKGLCGLYSASFVDQNGVTHGYSTSLTTAPGGPYASSWDTYFYFGTSGSY